MLKVMLPVDGSPNALRAVNYVIQLARTGSRVTVHLAHAHEEPLLYGELGIFVSKEQIAERIAARAEELGCHAIVMGTRGMGSIGNLLMGSVSTKVVHLATMPVTLVR